MKKLEELGEFTILSVEDDAFNQELAKAIFDDVKNINIYHASNGEEGLSFIEEHQSEIDIILLDLMMPQMTGLEFLEKVKTHPVYSVIPVIVVTSKSEEKATTYKLGADDFLSKPYNPEELKLRVFNHIRVKKFYDLMHNIKDNTRTKRINAGDNLCYLKEAIEVIDNSQKKLLNKLGNMAHESGFHNENASKRLGEYAKTLAQLYGFNSLESDNIYYSMSIYDIGLLRIQKEELTTEDSRIFRKHPELGVSILEDIEETTLINMAKRVILYHHEAWDGSGYPYKMRGSEIPVCAQIAGIVDMFDKLTVPRIYTDRTVSPNNALEIMKRDRGVMFNPEILDLFINNFDKFKSIKNRLA